jgi:hypothetical protein
MSQDDREEIHKIEELKRKLFSRGYETKIEYKDSFSAHGEREETPEAWRTLEQTNQEDFFMKTSKFKKFFIFSLVFFALSLVYVGYTYFFKGNRVSNENIVISILGNTFTSGGEELPLQIEIANKNTSALELADVIVEYPKGTTDGVVLEKERVRTSIGTIPSGGVKSENFKIILFGEQGSIQEVKVSLEYRIEGSNSIFIKDKLYNVTINSTPIDITVDAPFEATPNQDINLNVKAVLNASRPASKILVRVEYPLGFVFSSANPAPTLGNNVWSLGDLAPGAEKNIAISGKMVDVFDGEEKTFRIYTGSQSSTDKSLIGVVFNSLGHTVLVKKPFIEAKLFVNGVYQKEYSVDSKTAVVGNINWVNNLDTKVNDLEIRAKLSGNALNRKAIDSTGGFYNSLEDTIVWNKNSEKTLKEVEPGQSGTVSFSLIPLPVYSSSGLITQPVFNIEVSVSGKQSTEGNVLKTITNSETKVVKVSTDVGLTTKVLYYSGPFDNTGPIPPKSEKETTYTVVWSLSNTSNNASKIKVKSSLPPWVKFTGKISPENSDITFDSLTREVVWNAGNLGRGAGLTQAGKEVAFQISFTPSLSQVGSTPTLINSTVLTGHDDFANVDVRVDKSALNTRLTSDPDFIQSGARVVE